MVVVGVLVVVVVDPSSFVTVDEVELPVDAEVVVPDSTVLEFTPPALE